MSQLYLKAVNASTKAVSAIISAYLKELTGHYKLSYTLLTKAGKYLEKKTGKNLKEESYLYDNDYIDAVLEAEMYELELL